MFTHPSHNSCAYIVSVKHLLDVARDNPGFGVKGPNKGTSGAADITCAKTNLPVQKRKKKTACFSFWICVYKSSLPSYTWASVPLSQCLKLLGQICIEKSFAYQTAGMQSPHHLSLIYREMHVALTRRSACPLYLHLPSLAVSISRGRGACDVCLYCICATTWRTCANAKCYFLYAFSSSHIHTHTHTPGQPSI